MSFLTFLAPGAGRRQAEPNPRLAAENRRLKDRVRELEVARETDAIYFATLQNEHRATASVLGDEVAGHVETRAALVRAARSNVSNANAMTVEDIDLTALRAAVEDEADEYVDRTTAAWREANPSLMCTGLLSSRTFHVVPLHRSPLAVVPDLSDEDRPVGWEALVKQPA